MSAKGKGRLERIRTAIHRHREGKSSLAVTGCRDSISDQAQDDEYSVDMRQARFLREKLEKAKMREKRKAAVGKAIERTVAKMGGDKLAGVARRIGEAFGDKGHVTEEETPLLWNYHQGDSTKEKLKKDAAGKKTEDERKDGDKRRGKGKGRREEKEAKRERKDEEKRRKREEEKDRKAEEAQIRSEMRQRVSLAQIFF